MSISIIAAIGKNNELGKKNGLLWHLPADMKHFRDTTRGHTVVMGQKTFASIGHPLPNRRNIVLTKDTSYAQAGAEIVHSFDEAMDLLEKTTSPDEEVMIIGGGQIYKLFMDHVDKLYITHVDAEFPDAEIFFPAIDETIWQKTKSEKHARSAENPYDFEFAEYTKKVS